MSNTLLSRRTLLKAAPCAWVAAAAAPVRAGAHAESGLNPGNEQTIRQYYAAWEQSDWRPLDRRLTSDFTFTSAAGDDHIDKSAFKTQCWAHQHGFIQRFDLQKIFGGGNEAFVEYVLWTKNGKTLRNVEYLRLRGDQVAAVECYFGASSSYPSAVSFGQI
jgi:ketosteroid isomerase-like protein